MAYTTINKSSDYFKTKLYTGNGTSQSFTDLDFEPGFSWIKKRFSPGQHSGLYDTARGANKRTSFGTSAAEATDTQGLTSFDTNGFSVGSDDLVNASAEDYVSWNLKGGTTINNGASGTQVASVNNVNTSIGFSIITFTATGNVTTIAHNLGVAPDMIIVKQLNDSFNGGSMYHYGSTKRNTVAAETQYIQMQSTAAAVTSNDFWDNTAPTSTHFTIGTPAGSFNSSGSRMLAYCFVSVPGFSRFGTFEGNDSSSYGRGCTVDLGFEPAFVMTSTWNIYDSERIGSAANQANHHARHTPLAIGTSSSSGTSTESTNKNTFLSNGFTIKHGPNAEYAKSVYAAFAKAPMVGTNDVPNTAV